MLPERTYHAENVAIALRMAIREREEWEKRQGYTGDSGWLVGIKMMLADLARGTHVRVMG